MGERGARRVDGVYPAVIVHEADAQKRRKKKKQGGGRQLRAMAAYTQGPDVFFVRACQACFGNDAVLKQAQDEKAFGVIAQGRLETGLKGEFSAPGR